MAKARRGEPITLGFIGGSITRGERATSPDHQYADLVANWWQAQFPKSRITLVNAGVSGTNSTYGCLRTRRDLLNQHPDFVVVEFAVNDRDDLPHAQSYEGVVRQILAEPNQPAVLLLFMMHHDGSNAQQMQSEIGRQYQLPMISFRDALWPEISAGRIRIEQAIADSVHPNDCGHAAIATFIDSLLQKTLDPLPTESALPPVATGLPPARFTDLFARTKLIEAADLKPTICEGWHYDRATPSWTSQSPGSRIEFQITGQVIDLIYDKLAGAFGTARVTVDDNPPIDCDAWLNGDWGPLPQVDPIFRGNSASPHHIKIELLEQKNAQSTGHEFRIAGIGTAG